LDLKHDPLVIADTLSGLNADADLVLVAPLLALDPQLPKLALRRRLLLEEPDTDRGSGEVLAPVATVTEYPRPPRLQAPRPHSRMSRIRSDRGGRPARGRSRRPAPGQWLKRPWDETVVVGLEDETSA
jgi:hypothetical protein